MSNTLEDITKCIKENIDEIDKIDNNDPIMIYIGVGTYAGLMTHRDDGNHYLDPTNYHQYPPFIKELKKKNPTLHLHIVLIDPIQENPPYMTKDNNYTENKFYEESPDKYVSYDQYIHIYVLRKSVKIGDIYYNSNNSCINIEEDLNSFNDYCIKNNISLLYHDYTGRSMKVTAEYFDEKIGDNIDKIVYGLGIRADYGCYFDLTTPISHYPYSIHRGVKRNQLVFINLYKFINNREFYKIIQSMNNNSLNKEDKFIINEHFEEYTQLVKKYFKNNILNSLRMIYQIDQNIDNLKNFNENFFLNFKPNLSQEFLILYKTKKFKELFEELIKYYSIELDAYIQIKKFDISGYEMLKIITLDSDPYKWYNEFKWI